MSGGTGAGRRRGPVDPRLLRHVRAARWGVAGLVALGVVQAVLTLAVVLSATGVVVAVVSGTGATSGGTSRPPGGWGTTVVLFAALALRALTGWAQQVLAQATAARAGEELRGAVLRRTLERGPAWAASFGTGRLAALATAGPDALRPWFAGYLPALALAAVLPVLVVVVMFLVDPLSAVITAATLPLVPVFGALVGWATQRRAQERWAAGTRLAGHFLDVVRGLETLRLFGRAERQVSVVRETGERHREATMRVLRIAFLSSTALDLVATLSVGLVAVEAGLRVASGSMALGPALLVILLAPEAHRPLRDVGARFHAAADATAVIDDLDTVLSAPAASTEEVVPGPPARRLPVSSVADEEAAGERPGVAAVGLKVWHEGADVAALDLASLTVRPGEVVALRGPSGSGKTTALRVLAGVQDAPGAAVLVTGPRPLHLPQRPMLPFAGTVHEVLADAGTPSLWASLRTVGLASEIASLPLGLDEPLGENGRGLSSGQRQRLALARVLDRARREPVVLLLDEPTAHLDPDAELLVLAELRAAASRGCAVLLTAHRPAALAAADRVVDLAAPSLDPLPAAGPGPDAGAADTGVADVGGVGPRKRGGVLAPPGFRDGAGWRGRMVSGPVAVGLGAGAWAAGIALTAAATWLIVRATTLPPVLTLSAAVVTVRGSAVARPLLRYLERLVSHEVALGRLGRWRSEVYAGLVRFRPGLADRRGDLLTRVVDDVDLRVEGLLRGRYPAAAVAVVAGLAVVAAGWVDPGVGLVAGVGAVVAGVLVPALAVRRAEALETATAGARASLAAGVVETVDAVEELAARGPEALAPARRRIAALARAESRRAWSAGAFDALGQLVWAVVVTAVALLVRPAAAAGTLGPEVAAILVLGALALGEPLATLPDAALSLRRARLASARLAPARLTPTTAPAGPASGAAVRAGEDVRVRGLVAGWDGKRGPAVEGLDLEIGAGRSLALVGVSGSGKSTVAAVLAGLLEPWEGVVQRPARVGLVGDEVDHVFASTLRENLRLARPGAPDGDLVEALHAVGLGPWLAHLPEGLGTWLGEGGGTISGGQRRRLATARAVLADPELLILDEPTEGLDEAGAEALMRDLLAAGSGRTVLLLTHRREGLDLVDDVRRLEVAGSGPWTTRAGRATDGAGGSPRPPTGVTSARP